MKLGVIILSFLTILMLGNVVFYATSEDYRFFIKKIKYPDEIVYEGVDIKPDSVSEDDSDQGEEPDAVDSSDTQQDNELANESPNNSIEINEKNTGPVALSLEGEKILKDFGLFNLERNYKSESVFGITKEYPDIFFQYSSEYVSLYFFPTKSYEDLRDIFNVLAFDLPITINQVNNFGDRSFYINLKKGYEDGKIRIVIEHSGEVFGVAVDKQQYGRVKRILSNLETNADRVIAGN